MVTSHRQGEETGPTMADGSLGYASRLSFRAELGGQLGAPELTETDDSSDWKTRQLADLIAASEHVVGASWPRPPPFATL